MAIKWFSGFETGAVEIASGGDIATTNGTTWTADTSVKHTGSYSLKGSNQTFNETQLNPFQLRSFGASMAIRFWYRIDQISIPGVEKAGIIVLARHTAGGDGNIGY